MTGLASVVNSSGDGMFLVQLRTPLTQNIIFPA